MKPVTLLTAAALCAAAGLAAAQPARPVETAAAALPRGMVSFFQLNQCPGGWTEVAANWQGRYFVSALAGAAPGQTIGRALRAGENRPAGAHTHTTGRAFTGGNCSRADGCAAWGDNGAIARVPLTTDNGGLVAGTNAPYVTLRACVKN